MYSWPIYYMASLPGEFTSESFFFFCCLLAIIKRSNDHWSSFLRLICFSLQNLYLLINGNTQQTLVKIKITVMIPVMKKKNRKSVRYVATLLSWHIILFPYYHEHPPKNFLENQQMRTSKCKYMQIFLVKKNKWSNILYYLSFPQYLL